MGAKANSHRSLLCFLVSYPTLGLAFRCAVLRAAAEVFWRFVISLYATFIEGDTLPRTLCLPAALLFQKPAKAPATPARGTAHARGTPAPRRLTYAIAAPDDKTAWI